MYRHRDRIADPHNTVAARRRCFEFASRWMQSRWCSLECAIAAATARAVLSAVQGGCTDVCSHVRSVGLQQDRGGRLTAPFGALFTAVPCMLALDCFAREGTVLSFTF